MSHEEQVKSKEQVKSTEASNTPFDASASGNVYDFTNGTLVLNGGNILLEGGVSIKDFTQKAVTTIQLQQANGIYAYEVAVYCGNNVSFAFTDETGDTYTLNAVVEGNHNVKFNSSNPTIVKIAVDTIV